MYKSGLSLCCLCFLQTQCLKSKKGRKNNINVNKADVTISLSIVGIIIKSDKIKNASRHKHNMIAAFDSVKHRGRYHQSLQYAQTPNKKYRKFQVDYALQQAMFHQNMDPLWQNNE